MQTLHSDICFSWWVFFVGFLLLDNKLMVAVGNLDGRKKKTITEVQKWLLLFLQLFVNVFTDMSWKEDLFWRDVKTHWHAWKKRLMRRAKRKFWDVVKGVSKTTVLLQCYKSGYMNVVSLVCTPAYWSTAFLLKELPKNVEGFHFMPFHLGEFVTDTHEIYGKLW